MRPDFYNKMLGQINIINFFYVENIPHLASFVCVLPTQESPLHRYTQQSLPSFKMPLKSHFVPHLILPDRPSP